MNTRTPLESPHECVVLSVAFNGDCSCFALGLDRGFAIFDSQTCEPLAMRDLKGGVGFAQMMGKTNIIGLVGGGNQPRFAPNKLTLWDEAKRQPALDISALTPVRGFQLSKERVVVALQDSVRVYRFAKPPSFLAAYQTADNPWGLCCLSSSESGRIAFPGRTAGHVQLVEIETGNVSIFPAHSSAVRAMQMSPDGELLATASEKGTLIRVFATSNGARLAELRRGIDQATIYSLAFSPSGTLLACTSDKSTLHIFDVPHPKKPARQPQAGGTKSQDAGGAGNGGGASASDGGGDGGQGRWGFLSKIPMMPRVFSDVYSFASATFEADDEDTGGAGTSEGTTLRGSRPAKGAIGWLSENNLVVVGGGRKARWAMYVVKEDAEGRRQCVRERWRHVLGGIVKGP